jgi:16S rRNA C1402 N4-methylase RsmH
MIAAREAVVSSMVASTMWRRATITRPAVSTLGSHSLRAITGKPLVARDAEQRANPRSRSAKLRVVERIA